MTTADYAGKVRELLERGPNVEAAVQELLVLRELDVHDIVEYANYCARQVEHLEGVVDLVGSVIVQRAADLEAKMTGRRGPRLYG